MQSPRQLVRRLLLSPALILLLSVLYFAAVGVLQPEVASSRNLQNLLLSMLPLLALVIGQSFVLITGGIDLSLTAVVSLCSVIGAAMMSQTDGFFKESAAAVPVAVACVLVAGSIIGSMHGLAVAVLQMPPFLVTLTSLLFTGGLATLVTRSEPISNLPESFLMLGYGSIALIPYALLLAGGLALLAHVILRHTALGKQLYAVGMGSQTALISGIPVRRTLIFAYAASGFCAAVAALLYMARLETGKPALVEEDVLLDCIAAAVLGGASLFGGRGTIGGAVLGTLFITLIGNSLNFFGTLQIWHILAIKGAVILVAALLDAARNRIDASTR